MCGLRSASKEFCANGVGSMNPRKRRASGDSGATVVMRDSAEGRTMRPRVANSGAHLRFTKRTCLDRCEVTTCTRPADLRLAAGAACSSVAAADADAFSHFLM